MPAAHLLTDTEKSSGTDDFGCICEIRCTYIDTHISHTGHFAYPRTPLSRPTSGGPAAQAPRDDQARQTCQQLRHDPRVWTPQNLRLGTLKPDLHLRLCALRQATPQALLAAQVWNPQAWPPPQILHGHSGMEASSLASTSDLARPLQSPRNPSEMASRQWYAVRDTGASSLVRRNGKLQRQPLGLLTQTPHSVRVLLHKPRPGAPSGIGELFDAVDH